MKRLLVGLVLILTAATLSATSPPSISNLSTPYLPLQSSVKFGGVTYAAGRVAYGPVGAPVTISGSNFGTVTGTVTFQGPRKGSTVAATVTSWAPTSITVSVPDWGTTGSVVVTAGGQSSNGLPFIVTTGTYSPSCPQALPASLLTIATTSLPGGMQNSTYSTTLQATGGQTPYSWSLSSGSLPAGVALGANGTISGTPATAGQSSFTVLVTDAAHAQDAAALSIAVNSAQLTITTGSLPNGALNAAYSTALVASGGTTPYTWSISAGSLPTGLSLNSNTGGITGTPTASGTGSFTVQVKDASSSTATAALNITVKPVMITTISLPNGTQDAAYIFTLAAVGGTLPYTWSVSAGGLPTGLSLNASTGQITGTPEWSGSSASFSVQVTDAAQASDNANLSITISPLPPAETSSMAYTYDSQGRVLTATYTTSTGTVTVTYSYDNAGNRTTVVTQ